MHLTRREFIGSLALTGCWIGAGVDAAMAFAPPAVPGLPQLRSLAVLDALEHSFSDGRLRVDAGDRSDDFWTVLFPSAMLAGLAAFEFTDGAGPFGGDPRLLRHAVGAIDAVSSHFRPAGVVGHGDINSAYFSLVPITRAVLKLKGAVDPSWHGTIVDRCERLYASAAAHINRTHDYLNPRALEAVSALGLHRLTGRSEYLHRCTECLDELLQRQYASGAQPYHTGDWIWGRKPAQHYQFLSANLMLAVGQALGRDDAVEYVRRLADFSLLATNRRGEAFVATFEGLHKSRTSGPAGGQWPLMLALDDPRCHALGRATYELWAKEAVGLGTRVMGRWGFDVPRTNHLFALNEALYLGVREVPDAEPFVPPRGTHALPDISTVFVHEPGLDVSMCLLGGYSALAEADCGDVKLFAMTPELTAEPTFRNAGIDSRRHDWKAPTELLECAAEDGKSRLRGRVYTTYEMPASEQVNQPGGLDESQAFNRLLEVTITYSEGEMVVEYHTLRNSRPDALPARLLFLLIARPGSERPRLEVGGHLMAPPPPADEEATYSVDAAVGRVRFSAPDGSTIEIVPEDSVAERITAERPTDAWVQDKGTRRIRVKEANEGSLRLAFEGHRVLDRGRYRIRFQRGGT